jgi:hypothetical protein
MAGEFNNMPHDPESVRHFAEHTPWYLQWGREILAGAGIVALGILKFVGGKELQRREQYATTDVVSDCKIEIIAAITELEDKIEHLDEKYDERLNVVHERIDKHLDGA